MITVSEEELSLQGKILRELMARVTGDYLIGKKIKNGELRKKLVEPPWKCPEEYQMTKVEMKHFSMEYLTWKDECAPNCKKVVLQLHGGGYVGAMRNVYRSFAVLYSEAGKGFCVCTPDYRVAPENPFPAALEDAIIAFDWLIEEKGFREEDIYVCGDSAGGGLAMALCHYLKDKDRLLPRGIVAMSPWTDMTAGGSSYEENYEKDPLFGKTKDSLIFSRDYAGQHNLKNPYLSPLFGDFSDFPPMMIQVGTYEMLLSDARMVAQKAREQGVRVRLSEYEGMFHVFQMALLLLPESRKAWVEVEKFFEKTE